MRLITCSNSGPAPPRRPDTSLRTGAAGGLVPHLLSLLRDGGEWFFPVPETDDTRWPRHAGRVVLHPVPVGVRERRQHYEMVSIELLLWLFHYLHDTVTEPAFDDRLWQAWAAYRRVNAAFAEGLDAAAGTETVVLVNDYHFMLVPGMMSGRARVVYAHQVPWCEPQYFGILPAAVRAEILTSLLACDTIVFHAERWAEAFSRCCDRYVSGVRVADGLIDHPGGRTRVVAVPFPVDVEAVRGIERAETTQRWRQRFAELSHGRRLLVRVDRLDLWKNHPRGFAAFDALLQKRPGQVDEVWMLAVVARTRHRTRRHEAYEAACRAAVAGINEAWRRPGRPDAVTMLDATDPDDSRHRAVAALASASTVLVNPTYDGFNLVAKEAALVNERSAVLLSRSAGAYEYLAPFVTPLDPCDVSGTADALEATTVALRPPYSAEAARVRAGVGADTAMAWLAAVLGEDRR